MTATDHDHQSSDHQILLITTKIDYSTAEANEHLQVFYQICKYWTK